MPDRRVGNAPYLRFSADQRRGCAFDGGVLIGVRGVKLGAGAGGGVAVGAMRAGGATAAGFAGGVGGWIAQKNTPQISATAAMIPATGK